MPGMTNSTAKCLKENITRQVITFLNTTGPVTLFNVSGQVLVRVIAIVQTTCASAAGCNGSVGIAGATGAIIATTDMTLLAADEIWHDAAPDAKIELGSVAAEYIVTGGSDIILTLSAQVDSGEIAFYAIWGPLGCDDLLWP